MSAQDDRERTRRERIERLRRRVDRIVSPSRVVEDVKNVLKGMLDLLADES